MSIEAYQGSDAWDNMSQGMITKKIMRIYENYHGLEHKIDLPMTVQQRVKLDKTLEAADIAIAKVKALLERCQAENATVST